MIHKAKDLSPGQRLAIESLLGRAIAEQEDISVRALPQTAPPVTPERRAEIIQALQAYFAQMDAQRQALSPADAEDIICEALRSTRPGYRPLH